MARKSSIQLSLWGRILRDFRLLWSLIKDYWKGSYRNVSAFSLTIFSIAVIYIISPFDFIGDYIPFLGQLDDTAMLLGCLYLLEKDLLKYKQWKDQQLLK